MYIHKCIPATRVFTNRLQQALRDAKENIVKITSEVCRDIRWFVEFIPKFNGTATYVHNFPEASHTIALDASLVRVGGVWNGQVYTAKIPEHVKANRSIVHFEMINLLVALNVWKDWRGLYVKFLLSIWEDNEANHNKLKQLISRPRWVFVPSAYFLLNDDV